MFKRNRIINHTVSFVCILTCNDQTFHAYGLQTTKPQSFLGINAYNHTNNLEL